MDTALDCGQHHPRVKGELKVPFFFKSIPRLCAGETQTLKVTLFSIKNNKKRNILYRLLTVLVIKA